MRKATYLKATLQFENESVTYRLECFTFGRLFSGPRIEWYLRVKGGTKRLLICGLSDYPLHKINTIYREEKQKIAADIKDELGKALESYVGQPEHILKAAKKRLTKEYDKEQEKRKEELKKKLHVSKIVVNKSDITLKSFTNRFIYITEDPSVNGPFAGAKILFKKKVKSLLVREKGVFDLDVIERSLNGTVVTKDNRTRKLTSDSFSQRISSFDDGYAPLLTGSNTPYRISLEKIKQKLANNLSDEPDKKVRKKNLELQREVGKKLRQLKKLEEAA